MAKGEHLQVLMQGVEAWNAWRREDDEDLTPDLSVVWLIPGAHFRGAPLAGAYVHDDLVLPFTDLTGSGFHNLVLPITDLAGADLTGANLCGTRLPSANLCGANLWGADLTGADLTKACLSFANLTSANLTGANLSHGEFYETIFGDTDLT
jgi:uncharacterized protein YjbI with pentapeptide repeats